MATDKINDKHVNFFALQKTCEKPGCPICNIVNERITRYIDGMLFEHISDRTFRAQYREAGGFCKSHSKTLLTYRDGLAVAILGQGELAEKIEDFGKKKMRKYKSPCPACFEQKRIEEDFLLFTGSLEPRKNLKTLLRALEILKEKGYSPKLKIAGPAGWKNKSFRAALENSSIREFVEILGFLSKEKLEHLYATTKAFVFPSLYEGFGLPVLEALNAKARVFTSENSPMQEILGKLGIYFSPESEYSLAESLEKLYLNSTLSFYTEKELEELDTNKSVLLKWQ